MNDRKFVRADSRGRISLGQLTDVDQWLVEIDPFTQVVTMIPAVVVPYDLFKRAKNAAGIDNSGSE